jgi:hypothetical protein
MRLDQERTRAAVVAAVDSVAAVVAAVAAVAVAAAEVVAGTNGLTYIQRPHFS